jgi:hypothetical protein
MIMCHVFQSEHRHKNKARALNGWHSNVDSNTFKQVLWKLVLRDISESDKHESLNLW